MGLTRLSLYFSFYPARLEGADDYEMVETEGDHGSFYAPHFYDMMEQARDRLHQRGISPTTFWSHQPHVHTEMEDTTIHFSDFLRPEEVLEAMNLIMNVINELEPELRGLATEVEKVRSLCHKASLNGWRLVSFLV